MFGLLGCASHIKTEVIGTRAIAAPPLEVVGAGTYEIAVWFDVDHAQPIAYGVTCPGVAERATVGETMDEYRARRVAEIAAQKDKERREVAGATSILVGALAPQARVQASGGTTVTARADGDAIGAGVANAAVDPTIVLPPGDVGAGRYRDKLRVVTTGSGACSVQAPPDAVGGYRITRIRDLDAEARAREAALADRAREVRASMTGILVASGADPERRTKLREARIAADLEVHARLQAQEQARVEAHAQIVATAQTAAYHWREEYIWYLVGKCHADKEKHARDIAERERRDAELRAQTQATLELHRRQAAAAVQARVSMSDYLVRIGAHARPPMPPPRDGDGHWAWSGATWEWEGAVSTPAIAEQAPRVVGPEVAPPGPVVVGAPVMPVPVIIEVHHHQAPPPPPPQKKSGTIVRDHRK